MNRNIAFLIILIFSISALHAEAPELRNVMPNSWRKVTRLTANEEQVFIKENSTVLLQMKEFMQNDNDDSGRGKQDNFFIYKQIADGDIFYRILCTDTSSPNFLSPNTSFSQLLIYRNSWIMGWPYNSIQVWQRSTRGNYYSIDIIEGREGVKGILVTSLSVEKDINDHTKWSRDAYRKRQLYGQTGSRYYPMAEVNQMVDKKEYLSIRIEASDCLVDPNNPLRYSLQNAFDGDPSTSYVENTEDDLMYVQIYVNTSIIRKFAVINGYAQNMALYKNNNRIKAYGINNPITLNDNILGYQIFDYNRQALAVTHIYKGDKYNDTCLAEFNIYTTEHGWLFGDINEQ